MLILTRNQNETMVEPVEDGRAILQTGLSPILLPDAETAIQHRNHNLDRNHPGQILRHNSKLVHFEHKAVTQL